MMVAIKDIADGRRDIASLTSPPLSNMETAAIHQWKNGGLYGISPPLLRGNIQSFCSIMEYATTASRGSPLV